MLGQREGSISVQMEIRSGEREAGRAPSRASTVASRDPAWASPRLAFTAVSCTWPVGCAIGPDVLTAPDTTAVPGTVTRHVALPAWQLASGQFRAVEIKRLFARLETVPAAACQLAGA